MGDPNSWASLDLDSRLVLAVESMGWTLPTAVQHAVVPLACSGRSIAARAVTGSGKTGAYVLPVLQRVLRERPGADVEPSAVSAAILVPSSDLVKQVTGVVKSLCKYCKHLRIASLAADEDERVQRSRLLLLPDIVVGVVSRFARMCSCDALDLRNLQILVVDEADLILAFGDGREPIEDFGRFTQHIPPSTQKLLLSATLTREVLALQALVLDKDTATVDLTKGAQTPTTITHYMLEYPAGKEPEGSRAWCREVESEKVLAAVCLLNPDQSLRVIKGKTLVFASSSEECYRLKLVFEQFYIRSAVLINDSPVRMRMHAVEQFNQGSYDILITTDSPGVEEGSGSEPLRDLEVVTESRVDGVETKKRDSGKMKSKKSPNPESGLSRGIDFSVVACVLNYSLPVTPRAYSHRIGRTGRAGQLGTAITLCSDAEKNKIAEIESVVGVKFVPYALSDLKENLRYRVEDVVHGVTKQSVKSARLADLKKEILTSEKLKSHFDDNPRDLAALRVDRALQPHRMKPNLKKVPTYLLQSSSASVAVPSVDKTRLARRKRTRTISSAGNVDPLKKFSFKESRTKRTRKRNKE